MLNEVDVNKVDEIPTLLSDSWRFQIARFVSFKVPSALTDKFSVFSSLYKKYEKNGTIYTRKLDDIPNLEMALSIGMPIHQIMRSVTIQMVQLQEGIDGVAENINAQLRGYGLVPQTCKVIVLASLQLRDFSDPTSWASKPFPKTPAFFYSDNSAEIKKKYEAHINALKTEFPNANIPDNLQTVTSSLCDGNSTISSLLVMAGEHNKYEINDDRLKIVVDKKQLDGTELNVVAYKTFHKNIKNTLNGDKNIPLYATMLLGLLKYWDVMVITANNICLRGEVGRPRGLAGFVLCFERNNEVVEYFPLANALFAPIIHLYAKAALLEGAQHFYNIKESTGKILSKLRTAIDGLQEQRNQLHEFISSSYGEALARFRDDLKFKSKDDESLFNKVFRETQTNSESEQWGSRGIWHVTWENVNRHCRLPNFKKWLSMTFPDRYLHLCDDQRSFMGYFVEAIKRINNKAKWEQCFAPTSIERLEYLFLSTLAKEKVMLNLSNITLVSWPSIDTFNGFDVFSPHLENIFRGVKGNFLNELLYEVGAFIYSDKFIIKVTVKDENKYFTREMIQSFHEKIQQEQGTLPFAEWTRTRYMPIMWNKLYRRKVEIAWLNGVNGPILTVWNGKPELKHYHNGQTFPVSEFRFFFGE